MGLYGIQLAVNRRLHPSEDCQKLSTQRAHLDVNVPEQQRHLHTHTNHCSGTVNKTRLS